MTTYANQGLQLLDGAIAELRRTYGDLCFYTERDIVWTLQRWLIQQCANRGLPFLVFNDHATEPGQYRALSADIALVIESSAPVVMELKYEPSHRRADIGTGKFPVIGWSGVEEDCRRVRRWVSSGMAASGIALLIDEGATFSARSVAGHRWPIPPVDGGTWEEWGGYGSAYLDVHVHRVDVRPLEDA